MSLRSVLTLIIALTSAAFSLPPAAGQDVAKPDQKGPSRKEAMQEVLQKAQDDYRTFFKEPHTALEFWAAASFEIQVGKFDVAAFHIDKLLKLPQKEADEDLLKVEEAEGLSPILNLRLIKEWSKNAELEAEARKNTETLISRFLAALDKKLSDPERIARFIEGLSDRSPEVRSFSLYQLARSKHRAAPLLAEALRNSKPENQNVIKNALVALDPDIMPPLLELYRARDAKDAAANADFHLNLLWLARARMETRVAPFLWHMSSAEIYPKVVRDYAKATLAYLLDTTPENLPPAKVALTELAEKYYQHKVRLPDIAEVADRDDPTKLIPMPGYKLWFTTESGRLTDVPAVLKPDVVRFEFALRYARQAIDLDKSYLPAQALYLATLLEAEFTRKPYEGQLDKLVMEKPQPALQRLLAKVDVDLLSVVLERAMLEQNYAVMLPLIDAAGERGEVRLAQPSSGNAPGLLPRLLYYPDRRVQFAAARALLRLPASQSPVASARIVEVLQRFLASEPVPKVLIVYARNERAAELRNAAKEAGYASEVAATVRDAVEMLHRSADYDAIILNDAVPANEFPYVLTQLRSDHEAGRLPLLLIASAAAQQDMKALAARTPNTFALPEVWATKGPELKQQLEEAIKFAAAPEPLRKAPQEQQRWLQYEVRRDKGQAVSVQEKKRFAREALDWFAQMARGELQGYDLLPAKNALLQAINNEEMAPQALRVFARIPTVETQQRLAGMLFDENRKSLHILAAEELTRHIQKNGLALNPDQIGLLRALEERPDVPPQLRVELATLVGALRTTPQLTGSRLLNYVPDPEPAPEAKK